MEGLVGNERESVGVSVSVAVCLCVDRPGVPKPVRDHGFHNQARLHGGGRPRLKA